VDLHEHPPKNQEDRMKAESNIGRRAFLKGAAIFGGFAAIFGLAKPALSAQKESSPEPEEHHNQGYRLTEHVKKYYETAAL
jgi:hypothetical protein